MAERMKTFTSKWHKHKPDKQNTSIGENALSDYLSRYIPETGFNYSTQSIVNLVFRTPASARLGVPV